MSSSKGGGSGRQSLLKVHLHMHLDGAVRPSTLLELARARGVELPDDVRTAEDMAARVTVPKGCSTLVEFLSVFPLFLPCFSGDGDAIERVAYERCEDEANDGVAYCEARFAPHLLVGDGLDARGVVRRVLAGLRRGREDFGVDVRALLCCMRHKPEWSLEVVNLAHEFRPGGPEGGGVVGVDIAGDEAQPTGPHVAAFVEARRLGVPATAHAGEACGAESVTEALDVLHARRVGHGYRALEDDAVVARLRESGVHLECCPTSSVQTGSVPGGRAALTGAHPIARLRDAGVSVGINTDDPTVCGVSLTDEFDVAGDLLGFDLAALRAATLGAARASFLPEAERDELVARLDREWDAAAAAAAAAAAE